MKNNLNALKTKVINSITLTKGYSTALKLNHKELKIIRNIIEQHINKKIKVYKTIKLPKIKKLSNLHDYSEKINYEKFISQKNRILQKNDYKKVIKLPFYKKISQVFGDFKEVSNGPFKNNFGQFVIRLVRPGAFNDVGSVHADKWFFELNKNKKYYTQLKEEEINIKFWLPIYVEKNKSGLLVCKESQKKNYSYDFKYDFSKKKIFKYQNNSKLMHKKPVFDHKKYPNEKFTLVKSNPGEMIIFTDSLLHGGTNKRSKKTRVSLEFSIIVKKKNLKINSLN